MNTFKRILVMVRRSNVALTLAVVSLAWIQVQAQSQSTSKGAGAAKLLELKPVATTTLSARPAAVSPKACPKCRSEWSSRTDYTARGALKPKVWVERHLCEGCETTISVVGQGKGKRDVAVHKCTTCGAPDAGYCGMSKSMGAK